MNTLKQRLYLLTHKKQISDLHRVMWLYTIIFIIWGLYRLVFRLPIWFEEIVLKALVFGAPVFYLVLVKEKNQLSHLGMTTKGLIPSIYLGVFVGIWLAFLGRLSWYIKTGSITFSSTATVSEFGTLLFLGFVTAFWEQLLFVGYILPKLIADAKSEWLGIIATTILFVIIHIPAQLVEGINPQQIAIRAVLIGSLCFANSILFLRFKNLAAPVFTHTVWGAAIYLFG